MNEIGWIGTGVMGQSMCMHLLDAGHKINLYNRTMAKASPLIEKGLSGATHLQRWQKKAR